MAVGPTATSATLNTRATCTPNDLTHSYTQSSSLITAVNFNNDTHKVPLAFYLYRSALLDKRLITTTHLNSPCQQYRW